MVAGRPFQDWHRPRRWKLLKSRQGASEGEHAGEVPELQVHLRFQWQRHVVRGQTINAEVALEGLGLSVMGGLQDELFNLTLDKLKVSRLVCWSSIHEMS